MNAPHSGDMAQIELIAQRVADAAIVRFEAKHPERVTVKENRNEIPAPLKWAAGIIAALFTFGVGAFCVWMVTTLNDMQITVARIDERQQSQSGDVDGRFNAIDRRVTQLEAFHRTEGAGR